jgi:hypothetical protein
MRGQVQQGEAIERLVRGQEQIILHLNQMHGEMLQAFDGLRQRLSMLESRFVNMFTF